MDDVKLYGVSELQGREWFEGQEGGLGVRLFTPKELGATEGVGGTEIPFTWDDLAVWSRGLEALLGSGHGGGRF